MGRKLLDKLDEIGYDPDADGYVYRFPVQRKDGQEPWCGLRLYVGETVNIRQRMSSHPDEGVGIEFWDEENQIYRTDIPYKVAERGHVEVIEFYGPDYDQPLKKILKAKERELKRRLEQVNQDRDYPPIIGGK